MESSNTENMIGQMCLDNAAWGLHSDGPTKWEFLAKESEDGYCYILLFQFYRVFSRLPLLEFRDLVMEVKSQLGRDPIAREAMTTIYIAMLRAQGVIFEGGSDLDLAAVRAYEVMKESRYRLLMQDVGGKIHLSRALSGSSDPCWCTDICCEHGWRFGALAQFLITGSRRVGASGFDMSAFIATDPASKELDEFEDAYSSLGGEIKANKVVETWRTETARAPALDPAEVRAVAFEFRKRQDNRNGSVLDPDLEDPSLCPPAAPPLPVLRPTRKIKSWKQKDNQNARRETLSTIIEGDKPQFSGGGKICYPDKGRNFEPKVSHDAELRLDKLTQMVEMMTGTLGRVLEDQQRSVGCSLTPPHSPTETKRTSPRSEYTLQPTDSSSEIGRYGTRFMEEGTVLTIRESPSAADATDGRTIRVIEDGLISGYRETQEVSVVAQRSISKLKPINGLPRPFINTRLNFLCNISTALGQATLKYPNSFLSALMHSLRDEPGTPTEELLSQVLRATMDRRSGYFVANLFKLPYIEVGMQISEDSLIKCFDLLQLEYKLVWFQELKHITIPDFHKQYRQSTTKPYAEQRERSSRQEVKKVDRKSKSLLGF